MRFAFALLGLLAAPAGAQVQATYSSIAGPIRWEVAANGDYRAGTADDRRHRLSIGRHAWEVGTLDGRPVAASVETVAEARSRTLSRFARTVARLATGLVAGQPEHLIVGGRARIAGIDGRRVRYAIDQELFAEEDAFRRGEPVTGAGGQILVLTDDPRLVPLGEAIRAHDADTLFIGRGLIGEAARNRLHHSLDWLAAHGTMIASTEDDLRLTGIAFDPPAPGRLRPPDAATILDVDGLEALIREGRDPFPPLP